jgi:hypothetical protein
MKINRDYFREIWQYREIFYFFMWRDVKVSLQADSPWGPLGRLQPF